MSPRPWTTRSDGLVPSPLRAVHAAHRERFITHPAPRSMGSGLEVTCRRKDGPDFAADISLSPLRSAAGQFIVCTVRDETERRRTVMDLTQRTLHDPLTGAANRVLLLDRLEMAGRRASRKPGEIAVVFVDVDHFKAINDRFGHATGDEVLVAVAQRLGTAVRPDDTVARFGGDEFVVVADGLTGGPAACELVDRLIRAVAEPIAIGDGTDAIAVTISAGLAMAEAGLDGTGLLRAADEALYRAKQSRPDRVVTASPLCRPEFATGHRVRALEDEADSTELATAHSKGASADDSPPC
jgi:diguanylate cyclase (GGDEF)-like protein